MRSRILILFTLTCVVAAVAGQAATAAPKTVICGQIKHGPHATYTFLLNNKKLSGNTWTIFSTGAPCPAAMKLAPAILKWWAKAKIDASDFRANQFLCIKEADPHGSSGTISCPYSKAAGKTVELMMTGFYTVAQLKRMFFIG